MNVGDALGRWLAAWEQATSRGTRTHLYLLFEEECFKVSDVARVMNVQVSTMRMWRRGLFPTVPSDGTETRLAKFVAAVDVVSQYDEEKERPTGAPPAAFFESAVTSGCPLTPLDWFCAGRMDLIFRLLLGEDGADLMSEFDPDWRTRYASEWEVFAAPDGQPAIRLKG